MFLTIGESHKQNLAVWCEHQARQVYCSSQLMHLLGTHRTPVSENCSKWSAETKYSINQHRTVWLHVGSSPRHMSQSRRHPRNISHISFRFVKTGIRLHTEDAQTVAQTDFCSGWGTTSLCSPFPLFYLMLLPCYFPLPSLPSFPGTLPFKSSYRV